MIRLDFLEDVVIEHIMAQKLDQKELVKSNMFQIKTIIRILVKKGSITKQE